MAPGSRGDTFEERRHLVIVPSWIEDESLYSWCCRWHRHTLNRTRTTGVALFGVSSAAKVWNAPNPFGWFDHVTMGLLGTPRSILKSRTVAGSYLALAHPVDRQCVEFGELPPAYLFSAKSGINTSLRYCEKCAEGHFALYGVAIWRITHQLPGVYVCVEHGQPLIDYPNNRQIWTLPSSRSSSEIQTISQKELESMLVVAEVARIIFNCNDVEIGMLRNGARKVLCEAYGALDARRLDPEVVERDWRGSTLGKWSDRTMVGAKAFSRLWLTNLIRGRRSERNPTRWAFAIAYFSEQSWISIDGFFENTSAAQSSQLSLWVDSDKVPSQVLKAFEAAANIGQVSEMLGFSVSTVRRWMCSHPDLAVISRHWTFRR